MSKKPLDPFTIAILFQLAFCLTLLLLSFYYDYPVLPQARAAEFTYASVETQSENRWTQQEPETIKPTLQESQEVVDTLAKLVYGEAIGCSPTEQAAVVWCVLNRVDAGYGDIMAVATAPRQFVGYRAENPVEPPVAHLVQDVLLRWHMEKTHGESVGRVLPGDYLWFRGDGRHNHFRNQYEGGATWDWSLPSPYEVEFYGD